MTKAPIHGGRRNVHRQKTPRRTQGTSCAPGQLLPCCSLDLLCWGLAHHAYANLLPRNSAPLPASLPSGRVYLARFRARAYYSTRWATP